MPAEAICECSSYHRWSKTQNKKGARSAGSLLCPACYAQADTRLEELPQLYEDCGIVIARSPDSRLGKIRRPGAARPGFNEAAIDARSDIVSLLASWAAMVAEERQLTKPACRDVRLLAGFLRRHLDWLLTHVSAADFAAELADTVDRARRASSPEPGLHLELGDCVEEGCGERLFVAGNITNDGPARIQCAAGHAWHQSGWLLLAQRLRSSE